MRFPFLHRRSDPARLAELRRLDPRLRADIGIEPPVIVERPRRPIRWPILPGAILRT